nr:MAG TPA: hypothetical protein [Bacteriophage sp.]
MLKCHYGWNFRIIFNKTYSSFYRTRCNPSHTSIFNRFINPI